MSARLPSLPIAVVATVTLLVTTLDAQSHADLSGTWTLLSDKGPSFGKEFKASQDASSLTIEFTSGIVEGTVARIPTIAPVSPLTVVTLRTVVLLWQWVYRLDGSETRNPVAGAGVSQSLSKASWDGNKLVIVTSRPAITNGLPATRTLKQVVWLDVEGMLVVEEVRTYDTGLSSLTLPQTTTKGVYKKAS
jgi:hypothetical protein